MDNAQMPMDNSNMEQPMDGGQMPMDNGGMEQQSMGNENSDDTVSLLNQLDDDDKETARSYIKSLLKKNDSNNEQEQPIQETFTFSKKQIEKMNEMIASNEPDELDKDREERKLNKKNGYKLNNKKTPFSI